MIRIKVTKRAEDFHACIDGSPGLWDCGRSATEAIGALLLSHPEAFGVDIETPWRQYEHKDETP